MKPLGLLEAGFLALTPAVLALPGRPFAGWLQDAARLQAGDAPETYPMPGYTMDLPVDHFNSSDHRLFQNRFWVNDEYYKPGGPVIVFDVGEGTATPAIVRALLTVKPLPDQPPIQLMSAAVRLAQEFNGVAIALEHRYYGQSHPVAMDPESIPIAGLAGFRYLTLEQALEDVVYFAHHLTTTPMPESEVLTAVGPELDLRPSRTPWIWVGASYPGVRAAWLRLRNPDIIYAAWASSAPVEVREHGDPYYSAVYRAVPPNCAADARAVIKFVDTLLTSTNDTINDDILDLKTAVYFAGSRMHDVQPALEPREFLYEASMQSGHAIASSLLFPLTEYYERAGPEESVLKFCNYMQTFDADLYHVNLAKVASSRSRLERAKAWLALTPADDADAPARPSTSPSAVAFTQAYNDTARGVNTALAAYLSAVWAYSDDSQRLAKAHPIDPQSIWPWIWQAWSQFGTIPIQRHEPESPWDMGSKLITNEDHRVLIVEVLEQAGIDATHFPLRPNLTYAQSFGGWHMRPSNVMFTHGSDDPWRAFSTQSSEHYLNPPERNLTQQPPKCNVPPPGADVFGLMFEGQRHGPDLYGAATSKDEEKSALRPSPFVTAAQLFIDALKNEWLPCFNETRAKEKPVKRNMDSTQ